MAIGPGCAESAIGNNCRQSAPGVGWLRRSGEGRSYMVSADCGNVVCVGACAGAGGGGQRAGDGVGAAAPGAPAEVFPVDSGFRCAAAIDGCLAALSSALLLLSLMLL